MKWTDRHQKVFDFVDKYETEDSGVSIVRAVCDVNLDGVPSFRQDGLIEDICFELLDEGFLCLEDGAFLRVDKYPQD